MNKMVLVACERSQVVCAAFRRLGYAAFSNDIEPCYGGHPEWHIMGDAERVVQGCGDFELQNGRQLIMPKRWALIIAHPPCTMLTHASAVALSKGVHSLSDVEEGAQFFLKMLNAPAQFVAVENPAPMKCAGLPRYDQIIQPYNFGHPFSKRVCLWLRNLPPLLPQAGYYVQHRSWVYAGSNSSRRRSRTFEGIAEAMAMQWGSLLGE